MPTLNSNRVPLSTLRETASDDHMSSTYQTINMQPIHVEDQGLILVEHNPSTQQDEGMPEH